MSNKLALGKLNLLASYAFLQDNQSFADMMIEMADTSRVIIDSGAHSNFHIGLKRAAGRTNTGRPTTLEEYTAYVKRLPTGAEYIALDVIRNKAETDANLNKMAEAGLVPMPVYIEGYDNNDFQRILALNRRVCVAGAVGSSDAYISRRYRQIFSDSGGAAEIHALGYARTAHVHSLPITSCDSSSFNIGSRFGHISRYAVNSGFKHTPWRDFHAGRISKAESHKLYFYLRTVMGVKDKDIKNLSFYKGTLNMANISSMSGYYAYLRYMAQVSNYGVEYYAAVPTKYFILGLCAVLDSLTDKGFDFYRARGLYKHYIDQDEFKRVDYCVNVAGGLQ